MWDRYGEMVRLMRDGGVPILAGTDQAPDGASLHRELELLVEAGLSPAEAIAGATRGPAAFLGLSDEVGTVEAGKRADLVLLDGDPLADITNTRRVAAVVVGGVLLDRAKLQLLGSSEADGRLPSRPSGPEASRAVVGCRRSGADSHDPAISFALCEFAELIQVTPTTVRRWEATPGALNLHAAPWEALRALYQESR